LGRFFGRWLQPVGCLEVADGGEAEGAGDDVFGLCGGEGVGAAE
jgi:hypothetical protein